MKHKNSSVVTAAVYYLLKILTPHFPLLKNYAKVKFIKFPAMSFFYRAYWANGVFLTCRIFEYDYLLIILKFLIGLDIFDWQEIKIYIFLKMLISIIIKVFEVQNNFK